jgi:N-methylhydantoinase A/oxoprolinase/acetone carboxylase beta subunit
VAARYRVGFDIGGTFTDFALHDRETGALHVRKRLTTPGDPSVGALAGLDDLLGSLGIEYAELERAVHGTTIGANTVIERKGARTALLVTEGFRDLLIMQRPVRYSTYDLWFDKHEPLVRRAGVLTIAERLAYDGSVLRELDEDGVSAAVDELRRQGIESLAICFLHAYANPAHEDCVEELVSTALPDCAVSVSHDVAPVVGEYERASTTVVNAYVQPAFKRYLSRLEEALADRGFGGRLFVTQGNGGLATPAAVERFPVRALESGPAAGVAMAAWLGRSVGRDDVVAFDMGGTTAKVCLIDGGEPRMVSTFDVDQTLMRVGTGLPIVTPTVDVIEIGAGGGSIGRVALGVIEVGPESAGADPGPVCYGLGGTSPTVTDANVVLGYLNQSYFLGGAMALDADASSAAVTAEIATPLGLGAADAAWGIHDAVTTNMENAIRSVTIERGRDPRDLTLVAFGGAGPSHAARLARNLGMREVLFPAAAGIASAVGMVQAAPRIDSERTFVTLLAPERLPSLRVALEELEASVHELLDRIDSESERTVSYRADMQYVGQGHVVEVELPPPNSPDLLDRLRRTFSERYASMFGYEYEDATPQIVRLRVVGSAVVESFELPRNEAQDPPAGTETRQVYFPEESGYVDCPTFRREELPPGQTIRGPAVIDDGQCAILLLPGDTATVDDHSNVLAQVGVAQNEEREALAWTP